MLNLSKIGPPPSFGLSPQPEILQQQKAVPHSCFLYLGEELGV